MSTSFHRVPMYVLNTRSAHSYIYVNLKSPFSYNIIMHDGPTVQISMESEEGA